MASVATIEGLDLYPSLISPMPFKIGGGIRRSLNGTGYQKTVTRKWRVTLAWDVLSAEEKADVDAVWHLSMHGTLTVSIPDYGISGEFFIREEELPFEPLEGPSGLWRGQLTLEEQ